MELLFSKIDFYSASTAQLEKAKNTARETREDILKQRSDDELVSELVTRFDLQVPTVRWDEATVSRKETTIDLMYEPNTMASYERRSVKAPGEQYTIAVPFEGQGEMLRIRPTSYTSSPPRARVQSNSLAFDYMGQQVDVERAKREYEETRKEVIQYLTNLEASCSTHNQQLSSVVRPIIQDKRSRMEKGEASLSGFGLPIR